MLKKTIISTLLILGVSSSLMAQDSNRFNERKAKILEFKTEKLSIVNNSISCIKNAQNKEDLKKCRSTCKANNKALKQKRENFKKQHKRK